MARSLVRFDPFLGLEAVRKDLFNDGFFRSLRGAELPTTDIYTEDDARMVIEAHLPNYDEKDISVDVDRGMLVIQAERHEREEDKKKKYVMRESSSSFYRSIALPDQADAESVSAGFSKGVLTVTVPLAKSAPPKKIEITTGK
jgi:HSP20 family protein